MHSHTYYVLLCICHQALQFRISQKTALFCCWMRTNGLVSHWPCISITDSVVQRRRSSCNFGGPKSWTGFLLVCRIHFPWLFQTKWIIFLH